MALPKFQTQDQALGLLQTSWATQLNPVIAQPFNSGIILNNISLENGMNTINHLLSRNLQGWIIIGQNGNGVIWDDQVNNPIPDKTLRLVASSGVTVNLLVF